MNNINELMDKLKALEDLTVSFRGIKRGYVEYFDGCRLWLRSCL